ncbi:hypothetical protein [Adhaeribacter aquaticus]|uniref:hypothetical protein n=1 Tax=Adhaeribacter aquaticus TaxID=299567 RepID=UPI000417E006|nr:hypothetical protein [Adhaeribacter aquaticus]
MEPIPFKEQNTLLGAGDNPNTIGMPVAVSINPELSGERLHTVSFWKLSEEELHEIAKAKGVWISNMAWPPPPVMVMAEHPFKVHGFQPLEI